MMTRFSRGLLLVGLGLLIFGAKLALIQYAGSDLPVLDQWDGESERVIRPAVEHRLTAADLLAPHNEHRIITTKLLVLGLFKLNGQWDALFEMTVNAAIHTLTGILLLLLMRRWLRGAWHLVAGSLVLLLFALPFSWENTLGGFQVQLYLLVLFSIGHIAGSLLTDRYDWRWILGQLSGGLALATMASGFLSAVAILVALSLRLLAERKASRQQMITAGIATVLVASGWLLHTTVPGHEVLKAHSLRDFASALLALLSWPLPLWLPLGVAPAILFVSRILWRARGRGADPTLVALLAWSLLQCAALAYGRGGSGAVLSSRYLDLLAINVCLGPVFLMHVLAGRLRLIVVLAWTALVAAGLLGSGRQQFWTAVVPTATQHREQEHNVHEYLRSEDPRWLLEKNWPEIPYPDAHVLLQRLASPELRAVLPPSIRRPVQLTDPLFYSGALPRPLEAPSFAVAASSWHANPDGSWHYRSAQQSSAGPRFLRFRVAGNLGATPSLALTVRSADAATPVVPDDAPGDRWKSVTVFRPDGPWWVEARDADPTGWLAFSAPIEIGPGRWCAQKLLKHHLAIIAASLVLLGLGSIGAYPTLHQLSHRGWPIRLRVPGQNHSSGIRFQWWWIGLALVLLKFWLVTAQPVVAVGGASYDDRLYLTLADHVLGKDWLGAYDQLTLAKGPMYPLWIAATFLSGVPLPLANHLLYLVACYLLVQALRPYLRSASASWVLLLLLWWNPMTYEMPVLGRVLRQNLYTPVTVMFFAALVAFSTRMRQTWRVRLGWGILLGSSAAALWLTREETIWVIPSAVLMIALAVWRFWLAREDLRSLLVPMIAAITTAGAMLITVCALNFHYYGWFGTVEFRAPQFVAAYGALQRVHSSYHVPYVPVTREAREKIYGVSPAFAELRPTLEGEIGQRWAAAGEPFTGRSRVDREIAGGWFMWALRDAVADAGHCHSAQESLAFYDRLAREVNEACDDGRLQAGPRRDTLVPPWRAEYASRLFSEIGLSAAYFGRFHGFSAVPAPSVGWPELLQLFRDLTRWPTSPSPEAPALDRPRQQDYDEVRISVLDLVGRVFGRGAGWLTPLALAAWLALPFPLWRRRRDFLPWIVATALLGGAVSVVLINTLVHVMSFPNRSPGAFAQAYPLIIAFDGLVGIELYRLFALRSVGRVRRRGSALPVESSHPA